MSVCQHGNYEGHCDKCPNEAEAALAAETAAMTTKPIPVTLPTDEQIERALGDRRRLAELYQHLDLPSILIEWKDFALGGGIPKVQSPHYALAGMLEWAAAEIERLRAKEPVAVEGLVERVAAFLEPDIMRHTGKDWAWRQDQERKYAQRLLDETGIIAALSTKPSPVGGEVAALVASLRHNTMLLRERWDEGDGTSLDLHAADLMERAAEALAIKEPVVRCPDGDLERVKKAVRGASRYRAYIGGPTDSEVEDIARAAINVLSSTVGEGAGD